MKKLTARETRSIRWRSTRGFIRGHSWLQEVWEEFTPEELENELGSILMVLSFFATREIAEALRDETGSGKPLDEIAETMRGMFGDAMAEYVRLRRTIYEVRLQYDPHMGDQPKIGRNEACPCGSGRKYEKYCGAPSA